ncbi:DUF72 domain-containing protein [Hyphomicrobium sp.]|jgi:uncharacterized protein YecE (DUF72 family)|uniref:DUF72 domain-containing protein n=1 Tax=Hyphomicrobium sp. TaxID=82 RepID=UPI0035634921
MARKAEMTKSGAIRAGIGGWTFEPWRGVFYPEGLAHAKELQFASHHLTTIEVNGTYYSTQKPSTFANWAKESPPGFVFALKGPRYATNRRVLAEAGDSIARFIDSGVAELGDKLGPLFWQFAPTKKFDEADFGAFLSLLPPKIGRRELRHCVEVRHASFCTPSFVALAREKSVGIVFADHATYPAIADVTTNFVYARLQTGQDSIPTAYKPKALDQWAERAKVWASGGTPDDLPIIDAANKPSRTPRDVFVYFIHEGKVRAPAAAMAFQKRVSPADKSKDIAD